MAADKNKESSKGFNDTYFPLLHWHPEQLLSWIIVMVTFCHLFATALKLVGKEGEARSRPLLFCHWESFLLFDGQHLTKPTCFTLY